MTRWLLGGSGCCGSGPLGGKKRRWEESGKKGAGREQAARFQSCGQHQRNQNPYSYGFHGVQAEHSKVQGSVETQES